MPLLKKSTYEDADILTHMITCHPEEQYKILHLELDNTTGLLGYRSKYFSFKSSYLKELSNRNLT